LGIGIFSYRPSLLISKLLKMVQAKILSLVERLMQHVLNQTTSNQYLWSLVICISHFS
jgi:hypothetical protein